MEFPLTIKHDFLSGNEKTYSEILKFNMHTKNYEVFQRLLTNNCSDIKYFRANFNEELEHFLILANYESDEGTFKSFPLVTNWVLFFVFVILMRGVTLLNNETDAIKRILSRHKFRD